MCILCVLQRASRRARNMLPWLVLALVGLWGLSQVLLPPPFRLEMTASRLACVLFLVGYFSWYEFLFPLLSLWRARRSARLRERRWSQAVELQKLRKAATRRCRNCLNAYREQNPGGGRFTCSYCGHISKRPVLDIPGPPGSAGIIGDILGRICSQDWQPEGNGGSWYGITGVDESCLMERSYSVFALKLLSSLFLGVRRVFRLGGSSRGDGSSDVGDGRRSSGKGDNGVANYRESRSEKARRRAEEKKRVRLEKEMLEEEERKQREEVARLMEEQRKFRDVKLETIKEQQFRGSSSERMRCMKEELSIKRQERSKDREMGSCKSSLDGEEMEKKPVLEIDRKCDSNHGGDFESRNLHKAGTESSRTHACEASTQGTKGVVSNSRCLDRVRGSFLPTSAGFGGSNFFDKDSQNTAVCAPKPNKSPTGSVEQTNNFIRKEVPSVSSGRQAANGGSPTSVATHCPTEISRLPPSNAWKKSWHQLFSCSSTAGASSYQSSANDTNSGTMPPNAWQSSADHTLGSQITFSRPSSLNSYREMADSAGETSNFSTLAEVSHTFIGVSSSNNNVEENGLFEDPFYIRDTISLIEPVSEAPGTEFADGTHSGLFTKSSTTVSKPSPIESPLSKSCLSERKGDSSGQYPALAKAQDSYSSSLGSSGSTTTLQEPGVWKMWDTPLCRESLSMISASANRASPLGTTKPQQADILPSLGLGQMECIPEADLADFGILCSPNKLVESSEKGISHTSPENIVTETDPWFQNLVVRPSFNDTESQFPSLNRRGNIG